MFRRSAPPRSPDGAQGLVDGLARLVAAQLARRADELLPLAELVPVVGRTASLRILGVYVSGLWALIRPVLVSFRHGDSPPVGFSLFISALEDVAAIPRRSLFVSSQAT